MSTVDLPRWKNASKTEVIESWKDPNANYRCHILIVKEEEGGYSAIVLNLSGIGSCGTTEEEAMHNVREAISGAIESYRDAEMEIPWKDADPAEIPDNAKHKWILVDAK